MASRKIDSDNRYTKISGFDCSKPIIIRSLQRNFYDICSNPTVSEKAVLHITFGECLRRRWRDISSILFSRFDRTPQQECGNCMFPNTSHILVSRSSLSFKPLEAGASPNPSNLQPQEVLPQVPDKQAAARLCALPVCGIRSGYLGVTRDDWISRAKAGASVAFSSAISLCFESIRHGMRIYALRDCHYWNACCSVSTYDQAELNHIQLYRVCSCTNS